MLWWFLSNFMLAGRRADVKPIPLSGGSLVFLLLQSFHCRHWWEYGSVGLGSMAKVVLSAVSLKVSLLLAASLLHPIILVSFGKMSPWGQACTQGL